MESIEPTSTGQELESSCNQKEPKQSNGEIPIGIGERTESIEPKGEIQIGMGARIAANGKGQAEPKAIKGLVGTTTNRDTQALAQSLELYHWITQVQPRAEFTLKNGYFGFI